MRMGWEVDALSCCRTPPVIGLVSVGDLGPEQTGEESDTVGTQAGRLARLAASEQCNS